MSRAQLVHALSMCRVGERRFRCAGWLARPGRAGRCCFLRPDEDGGGGQDDEADGHGEDRRPFHRGLRCCSMIPTPTTGTDTQASPAVKNVARAPARSSGLAVEITTVRLPRMIAPIPGPATIPPARNNARLGGDVHAETTSGPRQAIIGTIPAASRRRPASSWSWSARARRRRGQEDRQSGQRGRRLVQRPGQERPREPGEQSADSECRAHPGRGRQELAAPVRRRLEPLRAVLRPR